MTDYLITPPDKLLDEWGTESFYIETHHMGSDPVILRAARRGFFTKIARWGARECCETPKERLHRLIDETGNEELIEAFNRLEES